MQIEIESGLPENLDLSIDRFSDVLLRQFTAFPSSHKEAHELTDAERIALCISAGCKMEYIHDGLKVIARTLNPVGIIKIDGKFRVYESIHAD